MSGTMLTSGVTYETLHDRLLLGSSIFPLDERFSKALAYTDIGAIEHIPLEGVFVDLGYALRDDPYAPDLLQAYMWVALKLNKQSAAQWAAERLQRTEGCIDCWMKRQ